MCLVAGAVAEAQTRPHRFEIAAGTMYGFQDPERPVTAGWIVSSGFNLGRQSFVVEGAWHRDAYALEHPWDFDEVFIERLQSRYWMLMGGVQGGKRQGRVSPYYWCVTRKSLQFDFHGASNTAAQNRPGNRAPVASRPVSGGTTSGPRRSTPRRRTIPRCGWAARITDAWAECFKSASVYRQASGASDVRQALVAVGRRETRSGGVSSSGKSNRVGFTDPVTGP